MQKTTTVTLFGREVARVEVREQPQFPGGKERGGWIKPLAEMAIDPMLVGPLAAETLAKLRDLFIDPEKINADPVIQTALASDVDPFDARLMLINGCHLSEEQIAEVVLGFLAPLGQSGPDLKKLGKDQALLVVESHREK